MSGWWPDLSDKPRRAYWVALVHLTEALVGDGFNCTLLHSGITTVGCMWPNLCVTSLDTDETLEHFGWIPKLPDLTFIEIFQD